MNIEGNTVTVNKSAQETYEFLTDVKNFESIMPESISKFEVLEEGKFVFALSGMPEIILKLKEKTPPSHVYLGAASDKLPFGLTATINELSENQSEVKLSFGGDLNPMMAMMAKGPITKFIGTLSEKISAL